MRKYIESVSNVEKELEQVVCNKCGKQMLVDRGIVKEGQFSIKYGWGYFSEKDGQVHQFDLCERCYDEYISSFLIPVEVEDRSELI